MVRRDSLAAATLDTLPLTVAVLDEDGDIRLTNRAWREFGTSEGRTAEEDDVGMNYVAAAAASDDEHARRAVDGLESVLDGDREEFSMEYPCHSPTEKRWFLMRAKRFPVDDEPYVSVTHLDITGRKLAELDVEETADRLRRERRTLEHVLERIDGVVREVTDVAVDARSRTELERGVCERLVASDPYVLAWMGRVDVAGRRLAPREWAADGDVPLEDGTLVLEADGSHPAVRALDTGETAVVQEVTTFPEADRWWPSGAGDAFRSIAALPVAYGDVTYGVLVVFADEPDAFETRELAVLESLAGTIATAINAIDARRLLTADTVVEVEVAIEDPSVVLSTLSAALGTPVSYGGLTHGDGGPPLLFVRVDRGDETAAREAAAAVDGVEAASVLSERDGEVTLELAVEDPLLDALVEHGAVIRRFDVADGVTTLDVDLSNGQAARSLYDLLERRYDVVELLSYHERERPPRTPSDVAARLESTLTDRQRMALEKAYYTDYFDWPRGVSGEELAESMGISRSTFHQHLRAAQRKLLDELFERSQPGEG
ncbi:bacterio-opsin activator domain-containing protein [Salinilacihabitans rarus]|uniref:bacterio-opsin activator domain-containing protein n=1 Tax=Salinilacihabitans rarus TaxID=2961596 RepID=UPI0020C8EA7C|nr:bacterio-opsin activator domain-containing protein [Salinilacihabitans rarus]